MLVQQVALYSIFFPLRQKWDPLVVKGSVTWQTTHVCSTVSTAVVCDPLLL
jgi:hypothetical protein